MKKGFTLTEMLGVLVLLSIISLIAIPVVLDLVKDTKTRTEEASINNYINAVNTALMNYSIENKGKELESGRGTVFSFDKYGDDFYFNNNFDIDFAYKTTSSGKYILKNGKLISDLAIDFEGTPISCLALYINDNKMDYSKSVCKLSKINNKKYKSYNMGDSVTLKDGSRWHVIEDTTIDDEKVVLFSDYFIDPDNNIQDTSNTVTVQFDIPNTRYDSSRKGGCGQNFVKSTGCSRYYDEIMGDSNAKKILDLYGESLKNDLNLDYLDIRLITLKELGNLGCSTENNSVINSEYNSWLAISKNYWTMTDKQINFGMGNYAVYVTLTNTIRYAGAPSARYGLRPVITISKEAIK